MASDEALSTEVLQFSSNLIGLYTKRFCSRSSTSLESLKCHHKFRACAHIGMPIFGISLLFHSIFPSAVTRSCYHIHSIHIIHIHIHILSAWTGDLLLPFYHVVGWLALTRCLFWEWRLFTRTTSTGGSHLRRPKMWPSVNIQLAGFGHKWSADSQVGGSQAVDSHSPNLDGNAKFKSVHFGFYG